MLIYVPLSQIEDNPFQARQEYGDVADLAGRIAAQYANYPESYGLMQIPRGRVIFRNAAQPEGKILSVAKALTMTDKNRALLPDPAVRVQLAFGHRRLRAFRHLWEAQEIGYERGLFPVQVGEFTDEQMLDAVWSENRERKDISAVEEAELLARKLDRVKSQREVAEAYGLDRSTVANRLRLLELPADIQQANRDGRLSERACLALAPVVQIQAAVNGELKWGSRHEQWGPPIAPAAFIKQAISDPKMTSDAIRDYAKRAQAHAGSDLHPIIADTPFLETSGIQQWTCKGCPARVNQTCLRRDCLLRKAEAMQAKMIAEAEELLGIPYSDRGEDFDIPFGHRKVLAEMWESGHRDGVNFVFGWRVNYSGYRPFSKREIGEYVMGGAVWEGDGRAAIMLGHRGALLTELLPPAQRAALEAQKEDVPAWETRQAWAGKAKVAMNAAALRAKDALIDALYLKLDGAEDIFQALIQPQTAEWVDEYEPVLRLIVDFLWDRSPDATRPGAQTTPDFERLVSLLNRAGLSGTAALTTGMADADEERTALLALNSWYQSRDRTWNWPINREELKRPLREALAVCTDDTWRYELERALRDVTAQVAKYEGRRAALPARQEATATNLAGEEDADLYGDEEDLDLDDPDAEIEQEMAAYHDILELLGGEPKSVETVAVLADLSVRATASLLAEAVLAGDAREVYSGAYALPEKVAA